MRCARCEADNREGRRFCAECGAPLAVPCAACGFANEPGEKFCGGCGTRLVGAAPDAAPRPSPGPAAPAAETGSRSEVAGRTPPVGVARSAPLAAGTAPADGPVGAPAVRSRLADASASPGDYTPRHLAARILTSKSALEGERKQVTVLFADLKGSMELLANRDPEEARALLDAVIERMMEAVHRYEGTVNQVMGDGIMALFGAPLALEEHATRACYAALALQEAIRRYAEEHAVDVPVLVRTGLNSGEVVVRAIGSDLHMDYSAIGPTVHLAARMEQMAPPNTILLTAETRRLAEGYVQVRALGPQPVKGLAEPVEIFELIGADSMRTRLQVSAARGLTPFVGRRAELGVLPGALALAESGHGQVVAVAGEAGMGKSRLFWEFTRSEATQGWRVLECRSLSYGKAATYLPVIELLKAYFHIGDRDGPAQMREAVVAGLAALDPALTSLAAPLLALLSVPVDDPEWTALDPPRRRQRTLEAVQRLILRESQARPVVLVFEDLHWIDSETQALLDGLVASLATARILLLVNYRPEYEHGWARCPHYTELRMEPLGLEGGEALLRALVGDGDDLAALRRDLVERTGGNPFFLEESVRDLAETGVLVGTRGRYRLARSLGRVHVAPTVQAILAARIDRLPAERKRLLQCASVVGRDVPLPLLAAIAGMAEDGLAEGLADLEAAAFLDEARLFPEVEYQFRHALTHDVAYASLLHERRRALHGRMVEAIERLHAGRLGEHVERLAHHTSRAELWPKAALYQRQAGAKALARSAHPEAVRCFEEVLAALARLPPSRETREQAVDVRFELRNSLWPLGHIERLVQELREAESIAESLGDQRRVGQVSAYMSQFFVWMGDHDRAVEAGRRTLRIAVDLGDVGLEVGANFRLGQVLYARGEYREAGAVLTRNLGMLVGDRGRQRLGMTGLPSVLSRAWLAFCEAELGEFDEGHARAREAMAVAEAGAHPFDLVVACFGAGIVALRQGELGAAIPVFERALGLCERAHVPFWFPMIAACLGSAYALAGRGAQALPLVTEAVQQHADLRLVGVHALFVAWQGEVQLLAGEIEAATGSAREAVALATRYRERGHEAWARWLLGEALSQHADGDAGEAEEAYRQALALTEELGMRPLRARCALGLGRLALRGGRTDTGAAHVAAGVAELRELGMSFWLAPAQIELNKLA